MEVIVELELTKEDAERLHIAAASKITLDELKRKMSAQKMRKALEASQEAAKKYGIDNWTIDDINNLIKEANEATY